MKTMKDYAEEVTKAAGIHRGSDEEITVHKEIYNIMGGGEYRPFDHHLVSTYNSKIANNIRRIDGQLGNKVIPHLSNVLKK
jgi:hypothetical protein